MIHIFRMLRGFVLVSTDNIAPERFFNLCRARNIVIWDIAQNDGRYYFCMLAKDFLNIKDILKKCGMKLVICRKNGLPFFVFRYRKHYSFVIGMLLAFTFLHIMSLFVWNITIDGNLYYTDNVIISYLQENGIYTGCKMKDIGCDKLEQKIRKDFEEITWVSVEKSGTRLLVHVKENDGDKITETMQTPSDIIASSDGVVESIITRCGTPLVKPGDTVKTGDVLVSGEIILYNDAKEPVSNRYVYADADIMVKTSMQYEDTVQRNYMYKIYTGRKTEERIFSIMGRQLSLWVNFHKFEKADYVTETNDLKLTEDFYLPVCIGIKTGFEYYTEEGFHTEEEITQILTDNYDIFLKKLQKEGIQIIEDSVKIDITDVNANMSGDIRIVMPFKERKACNVRTINQHTSNA